MENIVNQIEQAVEHKKWEIASNLVLTVIKKSTNLNSLILQTKWIGNNPTLNIQLNHLHLGNTNISMPIQSKSQQQLRLRELFKSGYGRWRDHISLSTGVRYSRFPISHSHVIKGTPKLVALLCLGIYGLKIESLYPLQEILEETLMPPELGFIKEIRPGVLIFAKPPTKEDTF